MEECTKVRKFVLKCFKLNGFTIRADAAVYLANQLLPIGNEDRQRWLDSIISQVQQLNLESTIITKDHIETTLYECTRNQPSSESVYNVVSAFDIPRFTYCKERNKFFKDTSLRNTSLIGQAKEKIEMFRRRYIQLRQCTLRHDLFHQSTLTLTGNVKFQLRNVEWFLCSSKKVENAIIIGLLVQIQEGIYAIEDLTGTLQIDISNAKFHDGLYPEHCFVLAEGTYEDKIFHVHGLGFPPPELSKKSRPYFGTLNTFGGPSEKNLKQSVNLLKIQERNPDAMIVFLSDVWLDKIKVLENLKTLFVGYSQDPPTAFVLMGNFISSQMGSSHAAILRNGLKSLGEIIASVPNILEKSNIVLVPGPSDIGSPLILPRPPLSLHIAEDFLQYVPKAVLATNPCRIQYCTREIVVIRADLVTKMCRNTIHFPASREIHTDFVKTIVSQGTLVPMAPNVCPIYWSYAHALDIYPLPDLAVIADQFNAFSTEHMDCIFMNPGSFMKHGFSFRVYLPATNQVEESIIPEDE